ncbi:enoyl-CoA hydratase/isomerase family protein [Sphingobium sp. JS3065]|uniref:enoyl-CoA hydratase/isomerase family protein n=1 Tax=Sphingobium sp. JS3065 TaxID=2970925 RepID=UPI002263F43A|nr:enoyl-CoA hydratase/isomerase family protein [Sphingobium sp. JS3065]UZW57461.1 enoyl-CoA hydratase/isomerase family protein [Sphingobium sp. JS3065]
MIKTERFGAVLTIFLDRPEQRNAMSDAVVSSLIETVRDADHDDDLGAIILTGTGRGFCAGSDLTGLAAMSPADRQRFEADSGQVARMIGQSAKPVIAAVHGFAIGGGLTLAASCDIVITDAAAKWSMPEVPIGLFPAWGIGAIISRIGVPAARRLCWGIDTLSGTEAQACGLADLVEDRPLEAAIVLAERLAALPRWQAGAVKTFFSSFVPEERLDIEANRLFLNATTSPVAEKSFTRFGGKT